MVHTGDYYVKRYGVIHSLASASELGALHKQTGRYVLSTKSFELIIEESDFLFHAEMQ